MLQRTIWSRACHSSLHIATVRQPTPSIAATIFKHAFAVVSSTLEGRAESGQTETHREAVSACSQDSYMALY